MTENRPKLLLTGDEIEEEDIPLKVEITNHPNPPQETDKTSWEEPDPWDFIKMTDEDIKEAEEARIA